MYRSFFGRRDKAWVAYGAAALLLGALACQVYTAVVFAEVMRAFGDLVQHPDRSVDGFLATMTKLLLVHLSFFVWETVINYVSRRFIWNWRKAITIDYIGRWNGKAGGLEGSSQRLTDAVNNFTTLALAMCMPIARAVMVMIAFLPMLWEVSREFDVRILGHQIPGILLWAAVLFSGFGTLVSWLVGSPLPRLEAQVQIDEARLRSELEAVHWEDHNHHLEGPQDLVPAKVLVTRPLHRSYRRLHTYLLGFDIWFGIYKQAWGFLPVFLLGLFVIAGTASYGAMMQAMAALNEANQSLSVFSSLMTTYTKFRSFAERLMEMELNLDATTTAAEPAAKDGR